MQCALSKAVLGAVRNIVESAQTDGQILDAYAAAEQIRLSFPEESISVGELVALMLRANLPAVEVSPPALIIELIFPVEDECGEDKSMERSLNSA
jgi:hypothetical protein